MTLTKEEEDFVKELLNEKRKQEQIAELKAQMWKEVEEARKNADWEGRRQVKLHYMDLINSV